ncbi:ankyrin repeat domain-containing protein [Candidatus Babela massiliensis]|uniref:Ankyrin repeats containing protein n=1 Tax=Candidatus Babela massiliensis TaxID=673862 RepID=V6DFG9_9BACT|nr:ankyrin repeat domain-containing protein [Candidatus Babela massiliensis]CDK30294.1 Ankyrin repeats containing protein [Candidatus Babela massiliensis]
MKKIIKLGFMAIVSLLLVNPLIYTGNANIKSSSLGISQLPDLPIEVWDFILEIYIKNHLLNKWDDVCVLYKECDKEIGKITANLRLVNRNFNALINHKLKNSLKDAQRQVFIFLCNKIRSKKLLSTEELNERLKELIKQRSFKIECFPEIIDLIIRGADANIHNRAGDNTLLLSLKYKQRELAKLLIENQLGIDLNLQNKKNYTALLLSLRNKQLDIAKLLILHEANFNIKGYCGQNALHLSAENGYIDIVSMLIDTGIVDINDKDDFGSTALIYASEKGHIDVVKLLVKYGADINCSDQDDHTALTKALDNGHVKIAKFLIKMGANFNDKYVLIFSLNEKCLEITKFLIENGVDFNIKDSRGYSFLDLAIEKEYIEIVDLIIQKGADINAQNDYGRTALMRALIEERFDVAKLLILRNANVNLVDKIGWSALTFAVLRGRIDIVELLVDMKANCELQDNSGTTILDIAKDCKHKKIVKFLKKYKKLKK